MEKVHTSAHRVVAEDLEDNFNGLFRSNLEHLFNAVESDFRDMKSFSDHIIGGKNDLRNFWAMSGTSDTITMDKPEEFSAKVTNDPVNVIYQLPDVTPYPERSEKVLAHETWSIGKKLHSRIFGKAADNRNEEEVMHAGNDEGFSFDENFVPKEPKMGHLTGKESTPEKSNSKSFTWRNEWLRRPLTLFGTDNIQGITEKNSQDTKSGTKMGSFKNPFKRQSYGTISSFLGGNGTNEESLHNLDSKLFTQKHKANVHARASPIEGYAYGGDFSIISLRSDEKTKLVSSGKSPTEREEESQIQPDITKRGLSFRRKMKFGLSSEKRKSASLSRRMLPRGK